MRSSGNARDRLTLLMSPLAQSAEIANHYFAMTRNVNSKFLKESGEDEASLKMFAKQLPKDDDLSSLALDPPLDVIPPLHGWCFSRT